MNSVAALLLNVIAEVRARHPEQPALIGVAGAQGSGKSYHCRQLEAANRPRFAHFSLDDVYWPKAKRHELGRSIHPLFITRGPPGTHDLELAQATIERLRTAANDAETLLPQFDKALDERTPEPDWPRYRGRPEAILVDGWCLGAEPPAPGPPLNALERLEDADGAWRAAQAHFLRETYAPFFAMFDAVVYLQAPSWEIVRTWRGQQEEDLRGRPLTRDENAALDRFVMHFERVTRSMLAGHHGARWIARLDEARAVTQIERRA